MTNHYTEAVVLISVIHLIVCFTYFMKSNKSILLFSDSFVMASAMFIGLPGIMTAIWWSPGITKYNVIISGLGLAMTVAVSSSSALARFVFIKDRSRPQMRCPGKNVFSFWRYLTILIFAGALSSGVLAGTGADLGAVPGNFAYLAVGSSFLLFLISRTQKLPKSQKKNSLKK